MVLGEREERRGEREVGTEVDREVSWRNQREKGSEGKRCMTLRERTGRKKERERTEP